MSAPSTSGLSVELLLRVIDVKYGCFTLLYFTVSRSLPDTEINESGTKNEKTLAHNLFHDTS